MFWSSRLIFAKANAEAILSPIVPLYLLVSWGLCCVICSSPLAYWVVCLYILIVTDALGAHVIRLFLITGLKIIDWRNLIYNKLLFSIHYGSFILIIYNFRSFFVQFSWSWIIMLFTLLLWVFQRRWDWEYFYDCVVIAVLIGVVVVSWLLSSSMTILPIRLFVEISRIWPWFFRSATITHNKGHGATNGTTATFFRAFSLHFDCSLAENTNEWINEWTDRWNETEINDRCSCLVLLTLKLLLHSLHCSSCPFLGFIYFSLFQNPDDILPFSFVSSLSLMKPFHKSLFATKAISRARFHATIAN